MDGARYLELFRSAEEAARLMRALHDPKTCPHCRPYAADLSHLPAPALLVRQWDDKHVLADGADELNDGGLAVEPDHTPGEGTTDGALVEDTTDAAGEIGRDSHNNIQQQGRNEG